MLKSLLRLTTLSFITISFVAHSGVVVDSTRHLYKEGAREISANIENKDDTPYLIKSWVEAPEGTKDSFYGDASAFPSGGKQTNTVRVFPNAYISKAPKDRETVYFFNVMSIPPTSDSEADKTSCSSPFATECASSIVHALFRI
jgi:P pilus assembly chaperone PapD